MQGEAQAAISRARYDREVEELQKGNDEEDQLFLPRQSGSLEWRSSRGEMGKDGAQSVLPGQRKTQAPPTNNLGAQ